MQKYKTPESYKGKTTENPYPSDSINPALKREKQYFLSFCEAFMSDYTSNFCSVPFEFGQKRSFEELRMYATGQQSPNKLKKSLLGKQKDGKWVTKMNVSFDTYYKLPQMIDVMRSKNMGQEYDVVAYCVDDESLASKEVQKSTLKWLLEKGTQDFIERTGYTVGEEITPEMIGAKNKHDVDMYFETGGFTLKREMACLAACRKTKLTTDYKIVQDQTFDDLITIGIAGWKTYIEASTKIPKFRKVNMDRAIIPYSDLNNFSDISRAGEIRIMTIAQIRKENPQFTAMELAYMAKCFAWFNPTYASVISRLGGHYNQDRMTHIGNHDIDPISRVKVMVLDVQWLSSDTETYMKNETNSGRVVFKDVDYNYELDKKARKDGQKKVAKNVIKKFEAQWIIGTEHFLNYGVCKDVIYYGEDGNKTPRLDYFFGRTGNASLVERAVAIVDDIDMAIIKQRNTLATLPASPAMAIQKDLLENVFLNGILQQPEDIMQALIERGVLYYNALDDHGKPLYMAGGQKPIDYLDVTKMAGSLSLISNHILEKVNELREVLGLQNGADAGSTSPYQGLGQTELAMQAANASLVPTFNAFAYIFLPAFDDIIKKWQITSKDKPHKISYSILGNSNLKVFELSKDFTNAEFNIELKIAPSKQEKEALLQTLAQQRELGVQSGGKAGLDASEWLYLYEKVMGGSIKEAIYVMANIEKKKREEEKAIQAQNQQANEQANTASTQAKAQADLATIQAKGEQDRMNTLVMEMLKQNSELMKLLYAPKKEGETTVNQQAISETIQTNEMVVDSAMGNGAEEQQDPNLQNNIPQEQQMAVQ